MSGSNSGETFAYFLTEDPNTPPLPLPVLASDRLAVVRGVAPGELTYRASALALIGGVQIGQVATPASGDTVVMDRSARVLYVNSAALAVLTILLPNGADDFSLVEIGFAASVTALMVQDFSGAAVPAAPINAFGPGAAQQYRFVSGIWRYWK